MSVIWEGFQHIHIDSEAGSDHVVLEMRETNQYDVKS